MNARISVDFKRFNEQCKAEGKTPFFLDSIEIDIDNESNFKQSMKIWQEALAKWWNIQK